MTTRPDVPSEPGNRGNLIFRLARNASDVEASQRLRYRVFYQEMQARADAEMLASAKDKDRFDPICDHLLVIKTGPVENGIAVEDGELVGTYRLLRQETAEAHDGFYSAGEFDIAPLLARNRGARFLELGRSCVLKDYRSKPVVELLWQGCWNYVREHRLDVMFGCASLEGTDIESHAEALSFLAYNAAPKPQWHARALDHLYVEMKRKPKDQVDQKSALRALPPLVKGYLRLGCSIGEGAIIDPQFNTTDVLIILPVEQINARYFDRFGKPA